MQYVLVNHDTKQLVCMISPAISQKRLARIASQRDVREDIPHDDDRLHEYQGNIEYAENVSLTYIMNRYSQYRKTAIVQHPLQWLVSLYYSTVLVNDKYTQQGGVRVTILEFLRDVKDYFDMEPHWQSYENMCHYCSVEYDYIIKTETSQEDVMILTDSKITDSPFKYDSLLRSLADDSIAVNIAKLYEREMTMFGYQWDMAEHKSSCTNWELYEYKQCCWYDNGRTSPLEVCAVSSLLCGALGRMFGGSPHILFVFYRPDRREHIRSESGMVSSTYNIV